MTVMVLEVTADMIAIIGAAVALGVGMFGSTRWIHKDVERLRSDMGKLEGRLVGRMDKLVWGSSRHLSPDTPKECAA